MIKVTCKSLQSTLVYSSMSRRTYVLRRTPGNVASEGRSGPWGVGSPLPSSKPCSLSHRQSTLSLLHMKETVAFRAQGGLSYQMITGDSESSDLHPLCISFA